MTTSFFDKGIEYKNGDKVYFSFLGQSYTHEGILWGEHGGEVTIWYVFQNVKSGSVPDLKSAKDFGYLYSWCIGHTYDEYDNDSNSLYIENLKKITTLMKHELTNYNIKKSL